mgnify:CR=1 FL=1
MLLLYLEKKTRAAKSFTVLTMLTIMAIQGFMVNTLLYYEGKIQVGKRLTTLTMLTTLTIMAI